MGRTRLVKTKIEELRKRIEVSEKHKKKTIDYLQDLKNKVLDKKISFSDYQLLANKKVGGKTPKEWINYYDNYANFCQKLIEKENKKKAINKTLLVFLSLIGLSILIIALFYAAPNIIGLIVQEEKQEFTQNLNLDFSNSGVHEWQLDNLGILDSVRLSGIIEGEGEVRVYLDDLLIVDSNDLQSKKAKKGITGQTISVEESSNSIIDFFKKIFGFLGIVGRVVEEPGEGETDTSVDIPTELDSSDSEESEAPPEDSSPSQEESASDEISEEETSEQIEETSEETTETEGVAETDEELPEETEEERLEEKPEETTETEEVEDSQKEIEITIKEFKDECIETCKLKDFSLNKSSYNLRIEITNAELKLEEIKYRIISFSESEEAPQNKSPSQEEPPISEENITSVEENITETNITQAPAHIKTIPDIQIRKNSYIELNLEEYFSNAEEFYVLQLKNISTIVYDHTIKFQPDSEFAGVRESSIIAINDFGEIEGNSFNIIVSEIPDIPENITNATLKEINISTLQYKSVINRPQKWIKIVKADKPEDIEDLILELPKEAQNISVKTGLEILQSLAELEEYGELVENADKEDISSGFITGNVALDIKQSRNIFERFFKWIKRITITGNVIAETELQNEITETADKKTINIGDIANKTRENEIAVEYYTTGPIATEEIIERGKRIKIYSVDEENYTDILAFAEIPEIFDAGQKERIKVYWREQNAYVDFNVSDLDNNGKIDYVEWIVPHLSNQTFDIILIAEAEHLDENREFISDIYEEVKELDGNWSEEIPDTHYVRVVFERNLTSDRDITLYPRTLSGIPKIEVYELNGTEVIAEFTSLTDNQYNKIFLDGSSGVGLGERSQDTFDLKVVGGSIEIEHIIDPIEQKFFEDCSTGAISDKWNVTGTGTVWAFGTGGQAGRCIASRSAVSNMTTKTSIDLSGEISANLSFNYTNLNMEAGDFIKVYANSSVEDFQLIFSNSNTTADWVTFNLDDYITLNSWVNLRVECINNDLNEVCRIDDINVTSYPDTTPPVVSLLSPANASNTTVANNFFASHLTDNFNVSNATLYIYNSTNDLIGNNFTGAGNSSITLNISYNLNYTGTFYWNVLATDNVSNQAFASSNFTLNYSSTNSIPQITAIFNGSAIGGALNEGPSNSTFIVNFSVLDLDGAAHLRPATAAINFSRTGEDVRYNQTCSQYQSAGNQANFTCLVEMWWWDGTGAWTISANISDKSDGYGINNTETFNVDETTGFVLAPGNITFPSITAGGVNFTANNDPIILNNTGNKDIVTSGVSVNATSLLGESDNSVGLYSGNFSFSNTTSLIIGSSVECGITGTATQMNITSGGSFINITYAVLNASNYTINNGIEGQEELYLCLLTAGAELTQQAYSTRELGSWTMQILEVLVWIKTFGFELIYSALFASVVSGDKNRRKKKKDIRNDKLVKAIILIKGELRDEYSNAKAEAMNLLVKEIKEKYRFSRKELFAILETDKDKSIPVTVFNKKLGGLEALVKYMKENLGMNYNEIAEAINRDQRTIWTAYKKASEKQKAPLEIKKTEISLSFEMFNKELTILENVILSLKGREMKYSEIARLLNRDQRNILTIYSRAVKKIK